MRKACTLLQEGSECLQESSKSSHLMSNLLPENKKGGPKAALVMLFKTPSDQGYAKRK